MTEPAAIECESLRRRLGDVSAVDDLSFVVERGEFFALLGPNGAGKTTTLRMLTTMLDPTSGSARLHGFDVVEEARHVRNLIGLVFQESALDERLTARENLEIHAVLYRIPRADVYDRINLALEWASLENEGRRRVGTLSGGMKKRLELARALMHNPTVLFLDEPTVGLDPHGRRHLWESIGALRGRGLTVFMTTHYLQEAEACDRVGIIDNGRLIALGTPAELRQRTNVSNAATLEDVFIALTGRDLHDPGASAKSRLTSFGRRGGERRR